MDNYDVLARDIFSYVGGEQNVSSLEHCMTRLRFTLIDIDRVDRDALVSLNSVVGVRDQEGGIQVVIGQEVDAVYEAMIRKVPRLAEGVGNTDGETGETYNGKPLSFALKVLSDCFTPLIPALIGFGLMNAVLSLLSTTGFISSESSTYQVLSLFGSAPMYFLPFMVAVTASRRLGVNTFITMSTVAVLLSPSFAALGESGSYVSLFGLPVRLATYSSAIVPVFLTVIAQIYIERFIHAITPRAVAVFLEPLLIFFILTTVTLIVLGPIASWIGDGIGVVFSTIQGSYGWLLGLVIGAIYVLLVSTGMHHGIRSVMITLYAANGYDAFWMASGMCANMALAGAVLSLVFSSRDNHVREVAGSTGATALMGITEPAIFGVAFVNRRVLVAAAIGGAVGGFIAGLLGVRAYAMIPCGLTALPVFLGETFPHIIIAILAGFIVAFVVSFILEKASQHDAAKEDA